MSSTAARFAIGLMRTVLLWPWLVAGGEFRHRVDLESIRHDADAVFAMDGVAGERRALEHRARIAERGRELVLELAHEIGAAVAVHVARAAERLRALADDAHARAGEGERVAAHERRRVERRRAQDRHGNHA